MPRTQTARTRAAAALIPDALTLARMALSPAIPLAARSRRAALTLTAACALSDAADGALARRLGTASERGARLDSAADVVFFLSLTAATWRVLPARQRPVLAAGAAPVLAIRAAAALTAHVRLGRAQFLHTRANKASGAALSAGALAVLAGAPALALAPGLAIALPAAIGELRYISRAQPPAAGGPSHCRIVTRP